MLEQWESEIKLYINVMPNKSRHVRRYIYTTVYTKPPKLCTQGQANYRCELPQGMAKRSISSPSLTSLSIEWGAQDPQYKTRILLWATQNPDFLAPFVVRCSHMIRIGLVYMLPGAPSLFPQLFTSRLETAIIFQRKIKCSHRQSFSFALRKLHTKIQSQNR